MKILHSIDTWLHPTENWILDQIQSTNLDQDVLCSQLISKTRRPGTGQVYVRQPRNAAEAFKIKLNNRFNIGFALRDHFHSYPNYDILFSHFGNRAWDDFLFTRAYSFKRVVRFYGIDLNFTYKLKYWPRRFCLIFDRYDRMIVEGPAMKRKLESFDCPGEKVRVIHHGVVPNAEPPMKTFAELPKRIKCLICGRFAEKKGFRYAMQALGELKQNHNIEVELSIIGAAARDNDFLEKAEMERINNEYHLNARFLGMVSLETMIEQMRQNDIFLSPSVTPANGDVEGGFPTTLIHAANQGMILVGTNHCDIPEIIHDGKNGYLSPERDVNSLVNHLFLLTTCPQKKLIEMSLYSYQLVKNSFSLANQGRALEALYFEILNS